MITRSIEATASGPVSLSMLLLGTPGAIHVSADPACSRATLTVRAPAPDAQSCAAVRDAVLHASTGALIAEVVAARGLGTVVHADADGVLVGGADHPLPATAAPVRIEVTVPPGSSITACDTEEADITVAGDVTRARVFSLRGSVSIEHCSGELHTRTHAGTITVGSTGHVDATSDSGSIAVDAAQTVVTKTESGPISIGACTGDARMNSFSGAVTSHHTGRGLVKASTFSGDITITATDEAVREGLRVQSATATGWIREPGRTPRAPRFRASVGTSSRR